MPSASPRINAGRHVNPCFAGDTVYAWSEVKAKVELPGRGVGALRLRTIATKDRPCADFPTEGPEILLDLDYTVLMPRALDRSGQCRPLSAKSG